MLHSFATSGSDLLIFMPRLAPYLQRRGAGFSFRISVPPDLRHLIGVREFIKALSETSHEAASPTALEFAAAAKRLFCEVRAMTGIEINHDKLQLVVAKMQLKLERQSAEEKDEKVAREHERDKKEAVRVARLEAYHEGFSKALEAQQRLIPVEVVRAASLVPVEPSVQVRPSPTLRTVVGAFLAQYEKRGKPQMLKKHRPALNMLVEVVGDRPVNELRQADINEFFEVLAALPPRWSDQCRQLQLSVRQLADLEHAETIGPKTFEDGYMASVRSFLKATKRDYGDQGFPLSLTTDGIEYLGDQEEDTNKQRAFKPAELERLFAGAEMQAYAADPAQHDKYWLPMLGLFTGARVNELCQLNPQIDITRDEESGIWHLWINAESEADKGIHKSVKTNDERRVPIHKTLMALGFVEHAIRLKKSGVKRLFPSWLPSKGRASGEAEKWFRQFLRDTGLRDETPKAKLLGMHAFRHTLLSYGTASKPSLNLGVITGHAQATPGVSAVQAGYNDVSITNKLQDRQELLDKLNYGIDFFRPLYKG